jgi:hypothetical protein
VPPTAENPEELNALWIAIIAALAGSASMAILICAGFVFYMCCCKRGSPYRKTMDSITRGSRFSENEHTLGADLLEPIREGGDLGAPGSSFHTAKESHLDPAASSMSSANVKAGLAQPAANFPAPPQSASSGGRPGRTSESSGRPDSSMADINMEEAGFPDGRTSAVSRASWQTQSSAQTSVSNHLKRGGFDTSLGGGRY